MRLLRSLMVIVFVLGVFSSSTLAQEKLKLFAGYSYLRPSITIQPGVCSVLPLACPGPFTAHPNLNGYEFSGTAKLVGWLGVTADFSGHYGTMSGTSSGHVQTFLFGPEVSLPAKVSPFAHALFGGAHEAVGVGTVSNGGVTFTSASTSGNAFASAIGGGIDLHVARFLSVRAIQVDYLVTRFNSSTQNQPRVSAGLVFRF